MRSGHVHRYGLLLLTFGYVDWWMGCECDWSMVFQLALNYLALSWFQSRINYMKSRQTTYSWFWHTLNHVKSHMISSLLFSLFIRVFIGHEIGVCAPMWFNRLLSPFTWSSAYLSSNNISVIQIWPYIHDFDVYPTGWNHSWFLPYLFRC